jgi:hypothetical protein
MQQSSGRGEGRGIREGGTSKAGKARKKEGKVHQKITIIKFGKKLNG